MDLCQVRGQDLSYLSQATAASEHMIVAHFRILILGSDERTKEIAKDLFQGQNTLQKIISSRLSFHT